MADDRGNLLLLLGYCRIENVLIASAPLTIGAIAQCAG